MQAFHGNQELKNNLLIEVEKHRVADQIISGTYGKEYSGKWQGCAVGCSIRSYNNLHGTSLNTSSHREMADFLDIPQSLVRLEDRLFEGMPIEDRAAWPGKFIAAIKPSADLSTVWPKFAIWLLVDADHGVIRYATSEKTKTAIERVAELYRIGGTPKQFHKARAAAASAYAAADAASADAYAAAAAAYSADAAAAADAYDAYAAYAAADAASAADAYAADAAATYAADAAATYAADAAAADAAADAAAAAARQKAFKHQSEKLLELMAEA